MNELMKQVQEMNEKYESIIPVPKGNIEQSVDQVRPLECRAKQQRNRIEKELEDAIRALEKEQASMKERRRD